MSWAADREPTRIENMAYSLLEIFDINMLLFYSKGTRTFKRLQDEFLRNHDHESLLAWLADAESAAARLPRGLFAALSVIHLVLTPMQVLHDVGRDFFDLQSELRGQRNDPDQ
jgi:hypothetical protein